MTVEFHLYISSHISFAASKQYGVGGGVRPKAARLELSQVSGQFSETHGVLVCPVFKSMCVSILPACKSVNCVLV